MFLLNFWWENNSVLRILNSIWPCSNRNIHFTMDKTCIQHYTPASRRTSSEWAATDEPRPNHPKAQGSASLTILRCLYHKRPVPKYWMDEYNGAQRAVKTNIGSYRKIHYKIVLNYCDLKFSELEVRSRKLNRIPFPTDREELKTGSALYLIWPI